MRRKKRSRLGKAQNQQVSGELADVSSVDFANFCLRLHKLVDAARGLILQCLGTQDIAVCCRALLEWACVQDKRVCFCVDDTRGPPYVPLTRISPSLVDKVHLCHDGRDSTGQRHDVITTCTRATTLFCSYGSLVGLCATLDWGHGLSPCLNLRQVRFRQCHLTSDDVAQLLVCSPLLEVALFFDEKLEGLANALDERQPKCPALKIIEVTDCHLTGIDASGLLSMFPGLHSVHFQAMDLHKVSVPSLPNLKRLTVQDCHLSYEDAVGLMRRCPCLENLSFCGNPLGGANGRSWPHMAQLRVVDLRHCELESGDEDQLRDCFPDVELTLRLVQDAQQRSHVMFASSGSESEV